MAAGFTYGTIHPDLQGWECQTSTGVGALGMNGIGSSARHVWRPISPSASTTDIDEAFKVFKFMADNTGVKWEIAGFRTSGPNEYVLGTTHDVSPFGNSSIYEVVGSVTSITSISGYSSTKEIFCIHCHHGGTKGASEGDISKITKLYNNEYRKEMPNIHQWYQKNGDWTIFPKHYVYHNATQNLYYYTPYEGQSNIFILNAKSHRDLYHNLGLQR